MTKQGQGHGTTYGVNRLPNYPSTKTAKPDQASPDDVAQHEQTPSAIGTWPPHFDCVLRRPLLLRHLASPYTPSSNLYCVCIAAESRNKWLCIMTSCSRRGTEFLARICVCAYVGFIIIRQGLPVCVCECVWVLLPVLLIYIWQAKVPRATCRNVHRVTLSTCSSSEVSCRRQINFTFHLLCRHTHTHMHTRSHTGKLVQLSICSIELSTRRRRE